MKRADALRALKDAEDTETRQLLADLARAKAAFQLRAIAALIAQEQSMRTALLQPE